MCVAKNAGSSADGKSAGRGRPTSGKPVSQLRHGSNLAADFTSLAQKKRLKNTLAWPLHTGRRSYLSAAFLLAFLMSDSLIKLDNIAKVFLTDEVETHALSGVHLDIRKGEFVSIAGPSGCGKSTLLSILGLLDTASSGTYLLNARPVTELNATERARVRNREIGFIFQSFNLIGDLDVFENVELPLTYRGMPPAERKAAVQTALERVGMGHRARHLPSQLSGGQQQRVAVARALAGKPSVLLADEPTGNLDSRNGDQVMQLLAELHKEGSTIVMVTHDARFAGNAQRSIHLFDGRVVDEVLSPSSDAPPTNTTAPASAVAA